MTRRRRHRELSKSVKNCLVKKRVRKENEIIFHHQSAVSHSLLLLAL